MGSLRPVDSDVGGVGKAVKDEELELVTIRAVRGHGVAVRPVRDDLMGYVVRHGALSTPHAVKERHREEMVRDVAAPERQSAVGGGPGGAVGG